MLHYPEQVQASAPFLPYRLFSVNHFPFLCMDQKGCPRTGLPFLKLEPLQAPVEYPQVIHTLAGALPIR